MSEFSIASSDIFNSNNSAPPDSSIAINSTIAVSADMTQDVVSSSYQTFSTESPQFKDYLTHPVQIASHTWTTTSTQVVNFSADLFNTYFVAVAANQGIMAAFSYITGDLVFRAVVQGSPFAMGKLVIAFDPVAYPSGGNGANGIPAVSVVRSMIVPHLIIDPSKDASYEIVLKPPSVTGYWSTNQTGSYSASTVIVNKLGSGTATEPTILTQFYVYLRNPQTYGLTLAGPEDVQQGVISSKLNQVSNLIKMSMPIFNKVSTSFTAAIDVAASAAASFGFSKPNIVDTQLVALNRTVDNYSQVDSRSTAYKLSSSAVNSIGISTSYVPLQADDMSILKICDMPGLVYQTTVATTATNGTKLLGGSGMRINPCLTFVDANLSSHVYEMTPLCHMASAFGFWTGDIIVDIEIVASVFHRCTLLFVWDPVPGTNPSYNTSYYQLHHHLITVAGNTSTSIRIPYRQYNAHMLPVTGIANSVDGTNNFFNGTCQLFVVNPLTSNGSTDPIGVNLYFRSDNIYFMLPDLSAVRNYTMAMAGPDMISPSVSVDFGRTDLTDISLKYGGEVVQTTKDMASKRGISAVVVPNVSALAASSGHFIMGFPVNELNLNHANTTSGSCVSVTNVWNFYRWFAMGYLGMRGSTDISFIPDYGSGASLDIEDQWSVSLNANVLGVGIPVPLNVVNSANYVDGQLSWGNYHVGYKKIHPFIDITVPFYNSSTFEPFGFYPNGSTYGLVTLFLSWTQSVFNVNPTFGYSQALGDDATFVFYRGAPALVFAAP